MKLPTLPAVMLVVMGLFHSIASLGTLIPSFVHDRVPYQFIPVWKFLAKPYLGENPAEGIIKALAVGSQVAIGVTEGVIGTSLLVAAFWPGRRLPLARFGLGLSAGLFGAFMLTMFAMHDKSLPAWNQYPAILAWIGVTWLVVLTSERAIAEKPAVR
ncbi:MAG: hypothetical protein KF787_13060 [Phycisphaeraceae bacterium]|nr:hypothetical protein [Phycisphaerae bacterium]MBX3393563.1 hypothetical protein [Phycisphaeraceae bacterium]